MIVLAQSGSGCCFGSVIYGDIEVVTCKFLLQNDLDLLINALESAVLSLWVTNASR